jgi:hypothetical protein
MVIADARYADAGETQIAAVVDGLPCTIPCHPSNRHYRELLEGGIAVAPLARTLTATEVKAEARRRILTRFPEWKQANMTARGVELLNIRVAIGSWTQAQAEEAAALGAAWDWIKAARGVRRHRGARADPCRFRERYPLAGVVIRFQPSHQRRFDALIRTAPSC